MPPQDANSGCRLVTIRACARTTGRRIHTRRCDDESARCWLQIARISSALPQHACRSPRHLLTPAPSPLPPHPAPLQDKRRSAMAARHRSMTLGFVIAQSRPSARCRHRAPPSRVSVSDGHVVDRDHGTHPELALEAFGAHEECLAPSKRVTEFELFEVVSPVGRYVQCPRKSHIVRSWRSRRSREDRWRRGREPGCTIVGRHRLPRPRGSPSSSMSLERIAARSRCRGGEPRVVPRRSGSIRAPIPRPLLAGDFRGREVRGRSSGMGHRRRQAVPER